MEKITKKELKTILEQHKLWLDSNEKEGKRADLSGANLTGADLTGANLTRANLRCANLTGANLTGTNLTCANLTGANLTNTILDEKEQCRKGIVLTEPMIGYKKSYENKIITLEIPVEAKVFSINNNKRRANKAKVIDMQGETELSSWYDTNFKYHVGDEIEIKYFDENYNVECGEGIHFFLTREESESFEY